MKVNARFVAAGLGSVVVAACVAGFAVASTGTGGGAVVKMPGSSIFQINGIAGDKFAYAPSTIRVKSGGTITFENTSKTPDAHTVTVVTSASQLPSVSDFHGNCKVCSLASGHLKDPNNPQKGVKAYVLNKGKPGFDTTGDSLLVVPKGPHKNGTIRVTAPAGTTLYFFCAIHVQMQGKIIVTG